MTIRRRNMLALFAAASSGALLSSGAVLTSTALVGCKQSNGTSGSGENGGTGDIVIGHYASLTGDTAHFGQDTDKAIKLAAEELNAAGGVLGRKVKIVTLDDRGDGTEAASAVNRLIDVENAVALLGEVQSSLSLAGGRVAQKKKIPMITPSSTNTKVTEVGDYVFRVCFIDPFQGNVMAKFARENLKLEKVAIIKDNKSDYSVGLSEAFKKAFEAAGGAVVLEQSYGKGDTDFSAQVTAVKNSEAQGMYVPGYYTEVASIAKTAQRLEVKIPMMGGDGWDGPDLFKIGGDAMEGSYYSNHFAPDVASENAKEFIAAFEKKNGSKPTGLGALGYDAARVLFEAIKRAGKTDGEALRDEIAKTKDFDGVTGKITINKERNAVKSAVVLKITGGAAKYEATVEP